MSTQTVVQQVPAGTYVVDPVHSSVNFGIRRGEDDATVGKLGRIGCSFQEHSCGQGCWSLRCEF